jgi:hypothetical protein
MARFVIFYSWQSDLPNRTNRRLIGDALERVAKALLLDEAIEIEPVIDRDTLNEPGAPDIASAILDKIDKADAVVLDVSIVSRGNDRPSPNPNVLVELGYALRALGHKRVVPVFNLAFGSLEELPFDLRGRRVLAYELSPDEEPASARRTLEEKLSTAIITVIRGASAAEKAGRQSAFLSGLVEDLIRLLIFGDEAPRRSINPWHDQVIEVFKGVSKELRDASADASAEELGFGEEIEQLAVKLDTVVNNRRAMGQESWQKHLSLIAAAVERARALKARMFLIAPVSVDSIRQMRSHLEDSSRKLHAWVARIEAAKEIGLNTFNEMVDSCESIGYSVLHTSYYPPNGWSEEIRAQLRATGQDLHLLRSEYRRIQNNNASEEATFEKLKKADDRLRSVVQSGGTVVLRE